jgi:FHA domain
MTNTHCLTRNSSTLLPSHAAYTPNTDSFIKHINLINNQRVEIGRQANARNIPAEDNGYFDSAVLSRQHAQVREEGVKVCMCAIYRSHLGSRSLFCRSTSKNVESSNGTFINGKRLSLEGLESEPYELKSDDIVVSSNHIRPHSLSSLSTRNCRRSCGLLVLGTRRSRRRTCGTTSAISASKNTNTRNAALKTKPLPLHPDLSPSGIERSSPINSHSSFSYAQGLNGTARRPPMQPQGFGMG